METLEQKLRGYNTLGYYPMHMPGHKRNHTIVESFDPVGMDITEIDEFDNLHHASGVIKNTMNRAKALYHSAHTFLSINGSTVGILAAISAATTKGDKVIVARNSHKAVYNAVYLNELDPIYWYPRQDGIYGIYGGLNPEELEKILQREKEVKLIIITSPTYEGIVSDISKIVKIAHEYKVAVMVDEAHGAHMGFDDYHPKNSIQCGADLVIHSLHKTLPSFTQTALIHVNSKYIDAKRVEFYLGIYETSSPSYLLMASIDQCIGILENRKEELFYQYRIHMELFFKDIAGLKHLKVMKASDYIEKSDAQIYAVDPSKLVISVKNTSITGKMLYAILREKYLIQLEMSSFSYALAMTSICDTREGLQRLSNALCEIDQCIDQKKTTMSATIDWTKNRPKRAFLSHHIIGRDMEECDIEACEGKIAGTYLYLYPPGIPIIVPGEYYSKNIISIILQANQLGYEVIGMNNHKVCIVKRVEGE